jgi:gamma-glutamyltranspeptidase/glutathione hydrolase
LFERVAEDSLQYADLMAERITALGGVAEGTAAPRWLMGRMWGAESSDLWLEARIGDQVARELKLRGQPVQSVGAWSGMMGHAQAIRIHPDGGFMEGGADPRGDGAAVGY